MLLSEKIYYHKPIVAGKKKGGKDEWGRKDGGEESVSRTKRAPKREGTRNGSLVTLIAEESSLPRANPVHSGQYIVRQKMYFLYFATAPQIENVFEIINRAYTGCFKSLSVMLLPRRDLTDRSKPVRICNEQKDCGTAQASSRKRERTEPVE